MSFHAFISYENDDPNEECIIPFGPFSDQVTAVGATLAKLHISTLPLNCHSLQAKSTRPDKDQLNPAPVTVNAHEKKEILFLRLEDMYKARNFESINDYDAWNDILCDKLNSRAQAAEWYEWYHLRHLPRGRQEVHRSMEPDIEQDMEQEIFKKNLSKANWQTGNTKYCAVADFLWDASRRDKDCLFLLGCLDNLLLSVRVDIEAFFLQYSTIVSEEPRFSKLGRDPIIRHMTYLRDYESNTPNIASSGCKAVEIDFIPLGQCARSRCTK